MKIKEKIKSVINKVKSKRGGIIKSRTDSELGAEEVVQEEVFPKKTCGKRCSGASGSGRKPASKRTRPTNNDYQMIDPDNDTCDSSKS